MEPTRCPICETNDFDREVYAANFDPAALNEVVFSARRLPDRLHYRMVRCGQCGVLRSDPILSSGELARLYESSHFTYAEEAEFARKTYQRYLVKALAHVRERGSLMEIGCGNGFFLQEALDLGFREVWGVEPSAEAIAQASERVRPFIKRELYTDATFPPGQFDVICGFQVLDHAPDPSALIASCGKDLKPGGIALFINHDAGALSARLLGEASPIVDVEHTALYDKRTMRKMFEKGGLVVRDVFAVKNTYPIAYWTKLVPLPNAVKVPLLSTLNGSRLGRIPVTLSAGNLGLIAMKAAA